MHEPYIYFLPKYMLKNKIHEYAQKIQEYTLLCDKYKYLYTDKARQNLRHCKTMLNHYTRKSHDCRVNLITKGL